MSGEHDVRGPGAPPEPSGEREFDDVRRAYAALGDEPVPPLLDARVRAKARDAVRPMRTRPRWLVPASLAATVLVAVGVALDVRREASRTEDYVAAPAEAPVADDAAREGVRPDRVSSERAERTGGRGPSSPAGSAPAAENAPPPRAAQAPADVPVTAAPAAKAAPTAAAVLAPAPIPAPPAPPPASADAAEATDPSGANATAGAPSAAASGRARAPASETAIVIPKQSAPAAAEQQREAAPLPPEEWLAKIDALRRQGRTAEADAELERFRRAYPDYATR